MVPVSFVAATVCSGGASAENPTVAATRGAGPYSSLVIVTYAASGADSDDVKRWIIPPEFLPTDESSVDRSECLEAQGQVMLDPSIDVNWLLVSDDQLHNKLSSLHRRGSEGSWCGLKLDKGPYLKTVGYFRACTMADFG